MALIIDSGSRSDATKVARVTLKIVRDWVLRFKTEGADGLTTRKALARESFIEDEQRARLAEIVEAGLIPAANGAFRWLLVDLAQKLV